MKLSPKSCRVCENFQIKIENKIKYYICKRNNMVLLSDNISSTVPRLCPLVKDLFLNSRN